MVKAKSKSGGDEVPRVKSGKKKEVKTLEIIAEKDGIIDTKIGLKEKKKWNRKNKQTNSDGNQVSETKNITDSETPEETTNGSEASEGNTTNGSDSSKANTNGVEASENKNKKKNKKNQKASGSVSDTLKDVVITDTEEGKEEEEEAITESQGGQKSNPESKKKRKRNKRKASEALEDATESKDDNDNSKGEKGAKKVKVEKEGEADAKQKKKAKKNSIKESKHVLFLGNLPYSTTTEEIKDHFKAAGDIVRVWSKSKGKGFAFIEFADSTAYNNALKMNQSELNGRKIRVAFTTPGKNTENRKTFIKMKTKKLLGQNKKKEKKGKKETK